MKIKKIFLGLVLIATSSVILADGGNTVFEQKIMSSSGISNFSPHEVKMLSAYCHKQGQAIDICINQLKTKIKVLAHPHLNNLSCSGVFESCGLIGSPPHCCSGSYCVANVATSPLGICFPHLH